VFLYAAGFLLQCFLALNRIVCPLVFLFFLASTLFPFPVRDTIDPEMKISIERRCDNYAGGGRYESQLVWKQLRKNDCYLRIASENLRHDHRGKIEEPEKFTS